MVQLSFVDSVTCQGLIMNRRDFVLPGTVLLFLALFVPGCGGKGMKKVKVYPASGEVFYKGAPADGAVIHFHPVEKGMPPAFATVQDDGSYVLTTYSEADGAAPGDYVVTINWRDERPGDGEMIVGPDRMGGRYAKPDVSKLRATITEGDNTIDPFDLKE